MLALFKKEMASNQKEISQLNNYHDLINNLKNNKISALLTIEEGGIIENDLNRLIFFYNEGVRLITLTWNYENSLGFPNSLNNQKPYVDTLNGLKPFGQVVVKKCEELGIIIDVSHLSDKGFYDVYNNTTRPFVASHSNARSVLFHPRNLTDDMILKIKARGGLIGLNFCPSFLSLNAKESKIEDMIKHIAHFKKLGALNFLALGSDFDGISGILEIKDVSEVRKLASALQKKGFSEDEIAGLFYKNAIAFFKRYFKE